MGSARPFLRHFRLQQGFYQERGKGARLKPGQSPAGRSSRAMHSLSLCSAYVFVDLFQLKHLSVQMIAGSWSEAKPHGSLNAVRMQVVVKCYKLCLKVMKRKLELLLTKDQFTVNIFSHLIIHRFCYLEILKLQGKGIKFWLGLWHNQV